MDIPAPLEAPRLPLPVLLDIAFAYAQVAADNTHNALISFLGLLRCDE